MALAAGSCPGPKFFRCPPLFTRRRRVVNAKPERCRYPVLQRSGSSLLPLYPLTFAQLLVAVGGSRHCRGGAFLRCRSSCSPRRLLVPTCNATKVRAATPSNRTLTAHRAPGPGRSMPCPCAHRQQNAMMASDAVHSCAAARPSQHTRIANRLARTVGHARAAPARLASPRRAVQLPNS